MEYYDIILYVEICITKIKLELKLNTTYVKLK